MSSWGRAASKSMLKAFLRIAFHKRGLEVHFENLAWPCDRFCPFSLDAVESRSPSTFGSFTHCTQCARCKRTLSSSKLIQSMDVFAITCAPSQQATSNVLFICHPRLWDELLVLQLIQRLINILNIATDKHYYHQRPHIRFTQLKRHLGISISPEAGFGKQHIRSRHPTISSAFSLFLFLCWTPVYSLSFLDRRK
nr:hypothetical protein CFP56_50842 [Quercus suber]